MCAAAGAWWTRSFNPARSISTRIADKRHTENARKTKSERSKEVRFMEKVICPYCEKEAVYLSSSVSLYANGKDYGPVFCCRPCRAWVGVDTSTLTPLGTMANGQLRAARMQAHFFFDQLWRGKTWRMRRDEACRWMAAQLGIEPEQFSIAALDLAQCENLIELSRNYSPVTQATTQPLRTA